MFRTASIAGLSITFTLFTAACAAPSEGSEAQGVNDEETVETTEEALISCGAAKYNEALGYYKNAVQWSKDREASGVCESENGYQWQIADEASKAVMTCGAFRNTIKTSVWAAPIRRVLGDSLTLRSLTGELAVIKDSQWQNWTGVDQWFNTTTGLRFWARAEGAYGSAVRVHFKANGQATYSYLYEVPGTFDIALKTEAATYTITRTGTASQKRKVTVKHGTKTETFLLEVEDGWTYKSAPQFRLTPQGTATTAPKLYSLVSECDA
jgi:hypothetical protein